MLVSFFILINRILTNKWIIKYGWNNYNISLIDLVFLKNFLEIFISLKKILIYQFKFIKMDWREFSIFFQKNKNPSLRSNLRILFKSFS